MKKPKRPASPHENIPWIKAQRYPDTKGKLDPATADPDDITADMMQAGWEEVVFVHADHFRLHRFYGKGGQDRMDAQTWPEALTLAQAEVNNGRRVLIYAVTASGRTTVCADKRWDEFSDLWEKHRGKTREA